MLKKIRESRFTKIFAVFLVLTFFKDVVFINKIFALTSGPSAPEVQSFEPFETNQMVDPFSGDFTYNIPLFELPGTNGSYPFNIAYHSGIGMDQEASWVGLGWNLSPGAINRTVRGYPDDFNGDMINFTEDMKPNSTFGLSGSIGLEIFGFINPNTNASLYYNSYKGVGLGLGLGVAIGIKSANLNLGIGIDSQNGGNFSMGISSPTTGTSIGIGFNTNYNQTLNLSISQSIPISHMGLGLNSTYSFSNNSFSPVISSETMTFGTNGQGKIGFDIVGLYPNGSFDFFWNITKIRKKNKDVKAYGYMNLENVTEDDLMDFKRSKESLITRATPNLPAPNLTYDFYNIQGQGVSGMFRPFRSDFGHVHDVASSSISFSESYSIEFGYTANCTHLGSSGIHTTGSNYIGDWGNSLNTKYMFKTYEDSSLYEPYYFKKLGDFSYFDNNELDSILGEAPVYIPISASSADQKISTTDSQEEIDLSTMGVFSNNFGRFQKKRIPRSMSIQEYKNSDIGTGTDINTAGNELLPEYRINYYTSVNQYTDLPTKPFTSDKDEHIRGFSVLKTNGMRYVYGLPMINNSKEEILETVNAGNAKDIDMLIESSSDYKIKRTNKYFKNIITPSYAYAYQLTSILGADYVDINQNGPDDADYGYWVKFNYVKTDDKYKWRAPYNKAFYLQGLSHTIEDDLGSFSYGSKEMWYLASVETNSHIAVFYISQRDDSKGADKKFDDDTSTSGGGVSYKLDSISIYPKEAYRTSGNSTVPLKTIHFDYNYSLCPGVPNNNNGNGKLTLQKIYFTYENNIRGQFSPYKFEYYNDHYYNNYDVSKYDRWGNLKNNTYGYPNSKIFPYTIQFPLDNTPLSNFEDNKKHEAETWNLKTITMPTGSKINISYEPDDYAYVQNRVATQMFMIAGLQYGNDNTVYDSNWKYDTNEMDNLDSRKIYFKLEKPVPVSTATKIDFFNRYIKGLKRNDKYQLYFKIRSNLRNEIYEYLSGYCDIDTTSDSYYGYDAYSDFGSGYTRGFITIKSVDLPNPMGTSRFFHPFALAAWQFMRVSAPKLLTLPNSMSYQNEPTTKAEKMMRIKSLLGIFNNIGLLFKEYAKRCFNKGWGKEIDLNNSWIRLTSPDKKKYGGGNRVKEITITDDWNDEPTGTGVYGTVYDYTTIDPITRETISSGVATYEPILGGDENAMHYAKDYPQNIKFKTPNNLFFEYPVNESYFPAPSVGYSKVTIRSYATQQVLDNVLSNNIHTTGETVNEYYTCKDFPIFVDETPIQTEPTRFYIPIPFFGKIINEQFTGSQGYSITLNDMHGKIKSITEYAQNSDGEIIEGPAGIKQQIKYFYKTKQRIYENHQVNEVDNTGIPVLINNEQTDYYLNTSNEPHSYNQSIVTDKILGEEYEFFVDNKYVESNTFSTGINFNLEAFIPYAYLPIPINSINSQSKKIYTTVTNKVIRKSGILIKTVKTDGQSTVIEKNILFDANTGEPLMTTTQNNFDGDIYTYNMPAYFQYKGMGEAYKNWKMNFSIDNNYSLINKYLFVDSNSVLGNLPLFPGDIYKCMVGGNSAVTKATYMGKRKNNNGDVKYMFFIENETIIPPSASLKLSFKLLQSGKKNMLTQKSGTIVSLGNLKEQIYNNNNNIYETWSNFPVLSQSQNLDVYNIDNNSATIKIIVALKDYLKYHTHDHFTINSTEYVWAQRANNKFYYKEIPQSYANNSIEFEGVDFKVSNIDTISLGNHNIQIRASGEGKSIIYPSEHDILFNSNSPYSLIVSTMNDNYIENINKNDGTNNNFCMYMKEKALSGLLNISATTYSDVRVIDNNNNPVISDYNWFATGEKGIWKPLTKYELFTGRRPYDKNNSDYLYQSGELSFFHYKDSDPDQGFPVVKSPFFIFDWQNELSYFPNLSTVADFSQYYHLIDLTQAWYPVQKITEYNNRGYELENKDVFNHYASALYGYNDNLAIAVAKNTKNKEIFFSSFENDDINEGNFDFTVPANKWDSYEIFNANTNHDNSKIYVVINKDYDPDYVIDNNYVKMAIDAGEFLLTNNNGTNISSYGYYAGSDFDIFQVQEQYPAYDGHTGLVLSATTTQNYFVPLIIQQINDANFNCKRPFKGFVSINKPINDNNSNPNNYSIEKIFPAHTGKKSLKISGACQLTQNSISLKKGKTYIIRAWIKRNAQVPSYVKKVGNNIIKKYFEVDNVVSESFRPVTNIINGWQLVEYEFVPSENGPIILKFLDNYGESYFIDDIRLSPKIANMISYVYDANNYRHIATLDNNNMATFYYYDSQGNLFLIKKETEKGIKTVQESLKHYNKLN